jgi:hypothetical protein
LSSTVRVPAELYQTLREIRLFLESEHYSAAPSVQDLVSVAIERFIVDWENPEERSKLIEELLDRRQEARSRMGKHKRDN